MAALVEVGEYELLISEPGQQQNCCGDSVGPGFVELGGHPRVVGVVSRGNDDGEGNGDCEHGALHTRVDPYLEWIHATVDLPCGTGLSEPCEPDPTDEDSTDDDAATDGGCSASGGATLPSWWIVLFLGMKERCTRFSARKSAKKVTGEAPTT